MSDEKLEALMEEVAGLKDLFLRRLYEDKTGKAAVEALVKQNEILNSKLEKRDLDLFAKELMLICDRIEANCVISDFSFSVREEILDVLERRGIIPLQVCIGDRFDPKFHKAVKSVSGSGNFPRGTIIAVARNGYISGDRILRSAEVVVSAADNSCMDTVT